MDIFSILVISAYVLGVCALAGAVFGRLDGANAPVRAGKMQRLSSQGGALGVLAAAGAGLLHFVRDHTPGTKDEMPMIDYVFDHPAILGAAMLGGLAILLYGRTDRVR